MKYLAYLGSVAVFLCAGLYLIIHGHTYSGVFLLFCAYVTEVTSTATDEEQ